MATKGLSLLDKAKAIPRAANKPWLLRIPEPQRTEVMAVLRAYVSGDVEASVSRLTALFKDSGIAGVTYNKVKSAIEAVRNGVTP